MEWMEDGVILVMVGGITKLGLMNCLVGYKAGLITSSGQITPWWFGTYGLDGGIEGKRKLGLVHLQRYHRRDAMQPTPGKPSRLCT